MNQNLKRFLALILSIVMIVSMLPTAALAEELAAETVSDAVDSVTAEFEDDSSDDLLTTDTPTEEVDEEAESDAEETVPETSNDESSDDSSDNLLPDATLEEVSYIAAVNGTGYNDLQEAIVAAAPAGTVELLSNVTVDEWIMFSQRLTIGSGQIITLDMDGLTIDGNNYTLTVNSIESATNGDRLFHEADNLIIKDLTITYADGVVGGISLKSGELNNVTFNGGVGVLPGEGNITITGCTFNTNGSAIYNETARDNLVVTGNKFDTAAGQYAIYLRGATTFTSNTVVNGKVNVVSGSPVVTGNDFGTERFKVYNEATAQISDNEINVLAFNDETEVKSIFGENTLSAEAKAVLDAATAPDVTYVAQIGEGDTAVPYPSLEEAFAAAVEGDTIVLLADAAPVLTSQRAITKAAVIDLGGHTLTLAEDDLYFGTARFENGTIVVDPSVKASTAVFWMFANQTLTFDDVELIATGVTGTYLIGINGDTGSAVELTNGSKITIANEATASLTAVICDNGTGNSVVIENSTVNVNNVEGRFYLGGTNGTITVDDSTINANGVKEGFYLRAGQTLSIEGNSNVTVTLNDTNGRYGINVTDATATYTKADTATVNATDNVVPAIPSVIEIYTWDDLKELDALVESGEMLEGVTVKLMNDIDLYEMGEGGEPVSFNPIGANKAYFKGTFDGQGHTIKNMYQSGWALGYDWYNYGTIGLFAYIWNATIKNLTIENAECFVEGGNVAGIAGCAWGDCTFENITIKNSTYATYNNRAAGIIGYTGGEGTMTFKNVTVDEDTVIAGLWGSFDSTLGGVVGSTQSPTLFTFEDVTVKCKLDCYNDVTASYKWYSYRMCGMLIGRMETLQEGTTDVDPRDVVTLKNVDITIGEWANHTYIWDDSLSYGCQRVEPGYAYDGIDVTQYPDAEIETIGFSTIIGGPQSGSKGYYGSDITKLEALEGFDTTTLEVEDLALEIRSRVAQVGGEYFTSLQEAVDAADDGDVITVIADHEMVAPVLTRANEYAFVNVDGKSITIDLNGKKITANPNNLDKRLIGAFYVHDYSNLVLMDSSEDNSGSVTLTKGENVRVYSLLTTWDYDSFATIENGNYYADSVEDSLIFASVPETLTVNDGNFTLGNVGTGENGSPWIFNVYGMNKGPIVVNGGTFNDNVAEQYWAFEVQLGENKAIADNGDGTWTVADAVASVTDKIWVYPDYNWRERTLAYLTLEEAVDAAIEASKSYAGTDIDGESVKVTLIKDVESDTTITVTGNITLDLNGKSFVGKDESTGSFSLISNKGTLTIKDSLGDGKITLTASNDRDWNAYSSVVSNTVGGKLTVESGIIEHLGGTDMAYGIDNLTNGKGTYAETIINGGTVKSTYRAIRQFLNGIEAENILTVNGGTIEGANKSIWMQDPSANANTGTLTIGAAAELKGDVYLFVTPGSTEWPVEVSIAAAALAEGSTVITGNVPEGYALVETNGVYGVTELPYIATIGDKGYYSLKSAFDNAASGETIKLESDLVIDTETFTVADGVSLTLDMNGKKITVTDNSTANYQLFYIYGEMTVIGNGTIELTATNNRAWNAMSAIFHNRGGVLTIDNGTYTHNGGTDMAYVVDNSGNYYGDATTNISDGTLTSSYIAIRNRMEQNSHGASGKAILNISGGTISAVKRAIWAQAASTSETAPATGEINISGGTIGLIDTARSSGAVSMTTISGGTVASFVGEIDELTVNGGTITGEISILSASGESVDYAITSEGLYTTAAAKIGQSMYATLNAAFDAVNDGETIVLLSDTALTEGVTVPADKSVILDLNGKTVSYNSTKGAADQLILNRGKLTIEDSGESGKMTFCAQPASGAAIPGYASNTITNCGELIVNGGTLENTTAGTAAYVVDNNSTTANVSLTVNDGVLQQTQTAYSGAIRLLANSKTNTNTVNMNGGEVIGRRAIWIHLPGSSQDKKLAELNITGGTITSTDASRDLAVYVFSYGDSFSGTAINISGADTLIDGNIEFKDSIATGENSANIPVGDALAAFTITGGTFEGKISNATASNGGAGVALGKPVTGGAFTDGSVEAYLAEGYELGYSNGKFIVKVAEAAYVASVGNKRYTNLQDALNVGGNVYLLRDVVLTAPVVIPQGNTVNLVLGGYDVTYTSDVLGESMITNNGTLTIYDSTDGAVLPISEDDGAKILYVYTGKNDAAYGKGNYTINNTASGKLTVNGGTIQIEAKDCIGKFSHALYVINGVGTMEINDGKILNNNNNAIRTFGDANITINGGEIEGLRAIWIQLPGNDASKAPVVNLTVTGGTLTGTAIDGTADSGNVLAVYSYSNGNDMKNVTFNISGGTFNGDIALTGGKNKNNVETVTITGGTFNGVNGTDPDDIGDVYSYYKGTDDQAIKAISITGGTFKTNGSEMYAKDDGYIFETNENGTYGVVPDPYAIFDLDDLKAFRDNVNNGNTYAGKTVYLVADIDLGGEEWTPIGNSTVKFEGTFDGQNHTISNLVVEMTGKSNVGLFGFTQNGEIKNLTVENAKVTGRLNVGVVAGTPYTSKFTNITVTGHVEVNGMAYVGGVGGKNAYADWTDITVDADDTSYVKAISTENGSAYRTYVGGVIGFMGEGSHTFENITSNIDVIGDVCDIGGIAGIAHYGNNFVNITCTGSVTSTGVADELGGIAGVWYNQKGQNVTMTNVTFTGTVSDVNGTVTGCDLVGGAYNPANDTADNSGSLIVDGVDIWLKVAAIGETKYQSLQAAIDAAKDGETVVLLSNATEVIAIAEGKNLIIDLNSKTLTGSMLAPNATLSVENGSIVNTNSGVSALEINAGTLNLTNVNIASARHAIRIDGAVTAAIDGGTYSAGVGTGTGTYHAVNVGGTGGEMLTIKSGTFTGPNYAGTTADSGTAVNVQGTATVNIEGGSFSGGKNSTLNKKETAVLTVVGGTFDQDVKNFCAEGFTTEANSDGSYSVVLDTTAWAAMIDSKPYKTLADALEAAQDGDTVTLLADVTSSVTLSKNIALDGNGFKLIGSFSGYNAGIIIDGASDVTVQDLTIDLTTADKGIWVKTGTVDLVLDGVEFVECGTAIQAGTQPGQISTGLDYDIYEASNADLTLTVKGTAGVDVFGSTNGIVIRSNSSVTLTDDCDEVLNGLGYIPMYDNTKFIGNGVTTIKGASQINVHTGSAEIKNLKFADIANGTSSWSVITGSAADGDTITVSGCTFGDYNYDALQITPKVDGAKVVVENNVFSGVSAKGKRAVHIEGTPAVTATVSVIGNKFAGGTERGIEVSNFNDDSTVTIAKNHFANDYGIANAEQIEVILIDGDGSEVNGCENVTSFATADMTEVEIAAVIAVSESTAKYFTTLSDAVSAAQADAVIELLKDIEASVVIPIDKSLTINGNGHKITSSASRVIRVTASKVELTLNNVNMVSTAVRVNTNDIRGISIDAEVSGANLTLNDCSVDFTDESANDWSYAVNLSGETSSGNTVTINGGAYEGSNVVNIWGTGHNVSIDGATLNNIYGINEMYCGVCVRVNGTGAAELDVKNSTFNGDHAVAIMATEDSTVTESNNTDNTKRYIAKSGSTYYYTLLEALTDAADGATIELLRDAEVTTSIKITNTVTVDMNGHTIIGPDDGKANYYAFVVDGGNLTLKDSEGTGELYAKCYGVETKSGSFTLESGKITATKNGGVGAAIVNYGGTVTIKDGTIAGAVHGVYTGGYFSDAETTILGGTITGPVTMKDWDTGFTQTVKSVSADYAIDDGYDWVEENGIYILTACDYVAVVTAPTCTEDGYTTYTCANCGDEYVSDYVDALGHSYADGECTVCGEPDPDAELVDANLKTATVSLSLQEYVGMQFIVMNSVVKNYDRVYAVVERAESAETEVEGLVVGNATMFEVPILAAEMSDDVTFTLYGEKDGKLYKGESLTKSVRSLSAEKFATVDDATKKVIVDMLNYGAAVQQKYGDEASKANLANKDLTAEQLAYGSQSNPSLEGTLSESGTETVEIYQKALSLQSKVELSIVLRTGDKEAYEARVTVNGETTTIDGADFFTVNSSFCSFNIAVKATDLREVYTIAVYEKATGTQVTKTVTMDTAGLAASKLGVDSGIDAIIYAMLNYSDSAAAL